MPRARVVFIVAVLVFIAIFVTMLSVSADASAGERAEVAAKAKQVTHRHFRRVIGQRIRAWSYSCERKGGQVVWRCDMQTRRGAHGTYVESRRTRCEYDLRIRPVSDGWRAKFTGIVCVA